MIKKLLKYDLKKMTKILVIFYAISIAFAGITRLINIGRNIQLLFILGQVFAGFTYSAIANILINTFIHILKVFRDDFYKDQSYLTHTLPIKKSKLLLSKYLASLIVIISSVVVCFLSLFIIFYSPELVGTLSTLLQTVVSGFNMSVGGFVTLFVFVLFSQICTIISMGFTAIVKGNTYNSKRGLKSLIWFAIYYFGSMVLTLATLAIIFAINGNINILLSNTMPQSAFITILVVALIAYTIYTLLFYFISNKLFNKGVNVD